MKKYISILIIFFTLNAFAQQNKGNWLLGVSSSSLGFNSNNGSETTLNVSYTEFETFPDLVDIYNLSNLFPHNYEIQEDKNSSINLNINLGYFFANKFVFGLSGGFENSSSVFKTGPLSQEILDYDPTVIGNNLGQYPYNYDLYYQIVSTADNDQTSKSTVWSVAPFIRYYHKLGFGSLFINASYSIGKGESEDKLQVISKTKYDNSKLSAGLGYSIALGKIVYLEPLISYEIIDSKSTTTRDVINPYDIDDIGVETHEMTRKSNSIVFSIGITSYL
tara:strand:+ start:296 stop:1126 length:831 start_codon:yes stop_codon:yes gene_type:complete